MGLDLEYIDGQTPLDEDETSGLLIQTISTRGELDEYEQNNIEQAVLWSLVHKGKYDTILSEAFIKSLHKRMYGETWAWAGKFRKTEKNIGVNYWKIPTELKNLMNDARFWYEHKTYSPDEFAIRFKHRLVAIHCFPNGNGRHSRLMADIIVKKLFNQSEFTWGAENLARPGVTRTEYLSAIKVADTGNIKSLLEFARS